VAEASQTKIQVNFGLSLGSVENDKTLVDLISDAAMDVAGPDAPEEIRRPSMGSEDFALYCAHVPAAMFRLGCVSKTKGGQGLHTPLFDLDEESMKIGAKIIARTALNWMQSNHKSRHESNKNQSE